MKCFFKGHAFARIALKIPIQKVYFSGATPQARKGDRRVREVRQADRGYQSCVCTLSQGTEAVRHRIWVYRAFRLRIDEGGVWQAFSD